MRRGGCLLLVAVVLVLVVLLGTGMLGAPRSRGAALPVQPGSLRVATPDLPGPLQGLGRQAQQKLDQWSADVRQKVDAETARLKAEAQQRAADEAGNLVEGLVRGIERALLDLVARIFGAEPRTGQAATAPVRPTGSI